MWHPFSVTLDEFEGRVSWLDCHAHSASFNAFSSCPVSDRAWKTAVLTLRTNRDYWLLGPGLSVAVFKRLSMDGAVESMPFAGLKIDQRHSISASNQTSSRWDGMGVVPFLLGTKKRNTVTVCQCEDNFAQRPWQPKLRVHHTSND